MSLVTRGSIVLVVGLMLGAAGCSVHWVVPVIEEAAAEAEEEETNDPPDREGPSAGEEADGDATDRAEREREAREGEADEEAEAEEDRRAERTAEREDEEETDRDAVERAEAERELREGDGDDEDAVERARAEREAREGGRGDEEGEEDADGGGEEDADDGADPEGDTDPEDGDDPEAGDGADDPADDEDAPGDDGADDADDDPGDDEADDGDDPDGTAGPGEPDAPDPDGPARRRVDVPPGHLPPEGQCRIWYDGVPPGLQAPAAPCDELLGAPLADGAFVLHADEDWDLEFEWEAVEAAHPGTVPGPVLALREHYLDRGDEDEANDEYAEPRQADVPAGHFPGEGMCRAWLEGTPAGQQADPVPCDELDASDLGEGAFLLYDGEAWDAQYDWAQEALRDPGSVPEVVLEILGD